ncbi:MAG: hypothetical protein EOL97_15980, partial [Spirochaetia bacterium]|nr:hypothetical protein [Spirochaetia bacterium]
KVDPGEDCDPSFNMYPTDVSCSDYFINYRENETAKISCTNECKYNLAEKCISNYSISNPCVVSENDGEVAFYFPFDSSYNVYSDWTKVDSFSIDKSWQVNNQELYLPSNGDSTLTLNYPIEDESYVISGQFKSIDDDYFGFYFNRNGSDYYRVQIANVLVSDGNSNYTGIKFYKNGMLIKENTNFAYNTTKWYDFKLSVFSDQDSDGLRIEFAISNPKDTKDEDPSEYNNYIIFDDASGLPSGEFAIYDSWNSSLRLDNIRIVYISDDTVCTPTVSFNKITVRAKSTLDYGEGANMDLWYKDVYSDWTKLKTFDVDNTNYEDFTYQNEETLMASGFAAVFTNDSCSSCSSIEPFADRNLYIDWVQYNDSSTRVESDDNTKVIRDFGGSTVDKWTDNISTSVAGDILTSVGALRNKFIGTSTNTCGNGICDASENTTNCPSDCFSNCGNSICEAGLGEDENTCPNDCDFSEIDLEEGLIAHYPLNGTYLTSDISGNEHHASNNGAVLTTGILGQSNGAYKFEDDDYLKASDFYNTSSSNPVFLSDGPSEIGNWNGTSTYTAWVNPSYLDSNDKYVFIDGNYNEGMLALQSTKFYSNWSSPAINYYDSVNLDQWYHVTMVHIMNSVTNSYSLKLYVNGELRGSTSTPISSINIYYG